MGEPFQVPLLILLLTSDNHSAPGPECAWFASKCCANHISREAQSRERQTAIRSQSKGRKPSRLALALAPCDALTNAVSTQGLGVQRCWHGASTGGAVRTNSLRSIPDASTIEQNDVEAEQAPPGGQTRPSSCTGNATSPYLAPPRARNCTQSRTIREQLETRKRRSSTGQKEPHRNVPRRIGE